MIELRQQLLFNKKLIQRTNLRKIAKKFFLQFLLNFTAFTSIVSEPSFISVLLHLNLQPISKIMQKC